MIVTVESPTGNRKWRVEPIDNGLCWRLMKSSMKKGAKHEWINCECYSATFDGAMKNLIERMICDPDDPCDLGFPPEDMKKSVARAIKAWLKDAKVVTDDADAAGDQQ